MIAFGRKYPRFRLSSSGFRSQSGHKLDGVRHQFTRYFTPP